MKIILMKFLIDLLKRIIIQAIMNIVYILPLMGAELDTMVFDLLVILL
jgi:hypothetical protein